MTRPIAPPEVSPKRRRGRFALSLRGLMVLVLVVGGLLGWRVRRATIQRRAVAEIVRAGGVVCYDWGIGPRGASRAKARPWAPGWLRRWVGDEYFQEPVEVYFFDRGGVTDATIDAIAVLDRVEVIEATWVPITDAWLARLTALGRLKRLELMNVAITDAGLARLADFPALEVVRLRFPGGPIGGASLARFAPLGRLKQIELMGIGPATSADFAALAGLRHLEWLRVYPSPADDACLGQVGKLTNLVGIHLEQTRVTDAGLARLAGLTRLQTLVLDGSGLTDAGMAHLAGMPGLTMIHLSSHAKMADGGITDAGLARLSGLRRVTNLSLIGSKITDAGLDSLSGMPLERLDLSGVEASDAASTRLLAGRQFRELRLSGPGITDSWLPSLAGQVKRLRVLSLARSRVTDAGMAHLAGLPLLEHAVLTETALTNAGLVTLARAAPGIRFVDARGTRVDHLGATQAQAARPGLTVALGPMQGDQ